LFYFSGEAVPLENLVPDENPPPKEETMCKGDQPSCSTKSNEDKLSGVCVCEHFCLFDLYMFIK